MLAYHAKKPLTFVSFSHYEHCGECGIVTYDNYMSLNHNIPKYVHVIACEESCVSHLFLIILIILIYFFGVGDNQLVIRRLNVYSLLLCLLK